MTRAQGPRPWSIRLFALLFLAQALLGFVHQITHLPDIQAWLAAITPSLAIDRDMTIVVTCARLTIALVPVALVWFLASRVACWLVVAMMVLRLISIPGSLAELAPGEAAAPLWIASLILALAGTALLFTGSSARWFITRSRRGVPIFE